MRSRLAVCAVPAVLVAALAALALAAVPPALADGDPASDYLIGQSTFLSPYDGHLPVSCQKTLIGLLASAKQKGFPLKVAVIATSYDLGSVPMLFRRPQLYARFLGQEDYYYWRSELLVVMPNGYGIYKAKGLPAADKELIGRLPAVDTIDAKAGTQLCLSAEGAVRALARRRGLTLTVAAAPAAASSGGSGWIVLVAVALLLLVAAGFAWFLWQRRKAAR